MDFTADTRSHDNITDCFCHCISNILYKWPGDTDEVSQWALFCHLKLSVTSTFFFQKVSTMLLLRVGCPHNKADTCLLAHAVYLHSPSKQAKVQHSVRGGEKFGSVTSGSKVTASWVICCDACEYPIFKMCVCVCVCVCVCGKGGVMAKKCVASDCMWSQHGRICSSHNICRVQHADAVLSHRPALLSVVNPIRASWLRICF